MCLKFTIEDLTEDGIQSTSCSKNWIKFMKNPIEAGIVHEPDHYLYSSAANYSEKKVLFLLGRLTSAS